MAVSSKNMRHPVLSIKLWKNALENHRLPGKFRVLLTEHNTLIAKAVQDMLQFEGFEVVGPSHTVSQALAQLNIPGSCDAAVLDFHLDDDCGWRIANVLVEQKIPFIVTANDGAKALHADLAGAPVILKPFSPEQLKRELKGVLSG